MSVGKVRLAALLVPCGCDALGATYLFELLAFGIEDVGHIPAVNRLIFFFGCHVGRLAVRVLPFSEMNRRGGWLVVASK